MYRPESFFRSEFELVVLPKHLMCSKDYLFSGTSVDDMEGSAAQPAGYTALKHGAPPQGHLAPESAAEAAWIAERIRALQLESWRLEDICVVLRTKETADRFAKHFEQAGMPIVRISRSRPDDPDREGVRLATMHRVKGLEFRVVFVAGMDASFPLLPADGDAAERKAALAAGRALLYVAASRASDRLFFSAARQWSSMLEGLGLEEAPTKPVQYRMPSADHRETRCGAFRHVPDASGAAPTYNPMQNLRHALSALACDCTPGAP